MNVQRLLDLPLTPLPEIMVAPNGARRTKVDHPALPITIPQVVACAEQCFAAGADGLHAHIRDDNGAHLLDAGVYRELLDELGRQVPAMYCQITSESAGRYSAAEQVALLRTLKPAFVSVGYRELAADMSGDEIAKFHREMAEANVQIQWIFYSATEFLTALSVEAFNFNQLLFVLGTYGEGKDQAESPLSAWLAKHQPSALDWAVCAFGKNEIPALTQMSALGAKVRIGFENSIWTAEGDLAADNAAQVTRLRQELGAV